MEEIRRIGRELVRRGNRIAMYEDSILMPDGTVQKWDFFDHVGAAAVVAVDDDGKILMVRQYRNSIDRETLEIPAGCKESKDEPGLDAALRELQEETGYTCRREDVRPLIRIVTFIAFCNETIDIFVADKLIKTQSHPDEYEFIEVERYSPDELMEMIYDGKICDSKTVAAVSAYCRKIS